MSSRKEGLRTCFMVFQVEKQVSLVEGTSVDVLRQRLQLLKSEWEDVKRERSRQVGEDDYGRVHGTYHFIWSHGNSRMVD